MAPQKPVPVTKTLVRNVEIPINRRTAHQGAQSADTRPMNARNPGRYAHPEQKTTLKIQQQMERIQMAPVPRSCNVNDLTPKAQEFVQTKASQRLNFAATATVFKGLEPINVNDSVLELHCADNTAANHHQRRLKSFVRRHDRDPEPVLTDYLRPVELMPRHALQVFGCDQVRLVQPADSDVFLDVCRLLDRLDCEE